MKKAPSLDLPIKSSKRLLKYKQERLSYAVFNCFGSPKSRQTWSKSVKKAWSKNTGKRLHKSKWKTTLDFTTASAKKRLLCLLATTDLYRCTTCPQRNGFSTRTCRTRFENFGTLRKRRARASESLALCSICVALLALVRSRNSNFCCRLTVKIKLQERSLRLQSRTRRWVKPSSSTNKSFCTHKRYLGRWWSKLARKNKKMRLLYLRKKLIQ